MAFEEQVNYKGNEKVGSLSAKIRLDEGKSRLLVSNGDNNLALFGYDDAGQVVAKIAKPGFNAESATDDQLIFNSNQNVFKIVQSGTITVTKEANASSGTGIITHDLGFAPAHLVYIANAGISKLVPTFAATLSNGVTPGSINTFVSAFITNTELYIDIYAISNAAYSAIITSDFKYYLLQETAV